MLEDEDEYINVNFTLTQVPTNPSPKPHLIELAHPIFSEKLRNRVCVFVKDPARDFKDEIQDLEIPCVAKVIGFDKLRRNYRQFEDKRKLIKDYDVFVADLRVYKMLPAVLGREFYRGKRFPIPVKLHDLKKEELQEKLNSVTAQSNFQMGNGPNYSLRVGRTSMEAMNVAKNLELALIEALTYATMHDKIKFSKVQ